jgi:predicted kinase
VVVAVTAPPALARQRLQSRESDPLVVSDADMRVYEGMAGDFEAIGTEHLVVDSAGDVTEAAKRVLAALDGNDDGEHATPNS